MTQFTFQNTISGGNVQVNQGQNVTATQVVGGAEKSPKELMAELGRILDESDAPESAPTLEEVSESPQMLCSKLGEIAEACPEPSEEGQTKLQQIGKVIARYWGTAKKPLLAFLDAALRTQAQNNWIVAGTLSAIKAMQSE